MKEREFSEQRAICFLSNMKVEYSILTKGWKSQQTVYPKTQSSSITRIPGRQVSCKHYVPERKTDRITPSKDEVII
jgi:hypothetical protein